MTIENEIIERISITLSRAPVATVAERLEMIAAVLRSGNLGELEGLFRSWQKPLNIGTDVRIDLPVDVISIDFMPTDGEQRDNPSTTRPSPFDTEAERFLQVAYEPFLGRRISSALRQEMHEAIDRYLLRAGLGQEDGGARS